MLVRSTLFVAFVGFTLARPQVPDFSYLDDVPEDTFGRAGEEELAGQAAAATLMESICGFWGHASTTVGMGELYVSGGRMLVKDSDRDVEVRDASELLRLITSQPFNNTAPSWQMDSNSTTSGNPPSLLSGAIFPAAPTSEDQSSRSLFVYGGEQLSSNPSELESQPAVHKFDRDTNIWATTQIFPPSTDTHRTVGGAYITHPRDPNTAFFLGGTQRFGDSYSTVSAGQMTRLDVKTGTRVWQKPLPPRVRRTDASLLYIPVGREGSLLLLGGLQIPTNVPELGEGDLKFEAKMADMKEVWMYDIAADTWYSQNATAGAGSDIPSGRSRFCALTMNGIDKDEGGFVLYVAGGARHEGDVSVLSSEGDGVEVLDDIYLLHLPSFTYYRSPNKLPTPLHGLTCHNLAHNQALLLGGISTPFSSPPKSCPSTPPMQFLELSSLTLKSTYDLPRAPPPVTIPSIIPTSIRVSEAPASGFSTPNLALLFRTPSTLPPTPISSSKIRTIIILCVALSGATLAAGLVWFLIRREGIKRRERADREMQGVSWEKGKGVVRAEGISGGVGEKRWKFWKREDEVKGVEQIP